MPIFAAFIGSLLFSVIGFFAKWLTKTVAIRLGILVLVVGSTSTLWVAFQALLASIRVVVPPSIMIPASWIMPDNVAICFAAYITARVLKWSYDMDLWAMKFRAI